jgi:hypothetical protein
MATTAIETPSTPKERVRDWIKQAAMAIPKEGYLSLKNRRYGPVYPRTPACHGRAGRLVLSAFHSRLAREESRHSCRLWMCPLAGILGRNRGRVKRERRPPTFSRVQDLAAVFLNLQTDGQKGVSPQQPRE